MASTGLTKEQFWKLYEQLSPELQEAIFSGETADHVWDACTANGVEDERISEVARYAGRVLLGLILPEDFQKTLEKEVGLKKDAAAPIARTITRLIFFPVKESIRQLHSVEVMSPAAPKTKTVPSTTETPVQEAPAPAVPKKEDTYRETVE